MSSKGGARLDLNAPLISVRRHAAPVLQAFYGSDSEDEEVVADLEQGDVASHLEISHELAPAKEKNRIKGDYQGVFFDRPSPSNVRFYDNPEQEENCYLHKSRQNSLKGKEQYEHNSPAIEIDIFSQEKVTENTKDFSSASNQQNSQDFSTSEERRAPENVELRSKEELDALSDQCMEHASAENIGILTPTCNGSLISGSDGHSTDSIAPSKCKDSPAARDFIMNRFLPAAMAIAGQLQAYNDSSIVYRRSQNDQRRVEISSSDNICDVANEDQHEIRRLDGSIMHDLQTPFLLSNSETIGKHQHIIRWPRSTMERVQSTNLEDEDWNTQTNELQKISDHRRTSRETNHSPRESSAARFVNKFSSEIPSMKFSQITNSKSIFERASSRTPYSNQYESEEPMSYKGKGFLGLPSDRIQVRDDRSRLTSYNGAEKSRYGKPFDNIRNSNFSLPSQSTLLKEADANAKLQESNSSLTEKLRKASAYYDFQDNIGVSLGQSQNWIKTEKKLDQGSSSSVCNDNMRHGGFAKEAVVATEVKNHIDCLATPSSKAIKISNFPAADLSNKKYLPEKMQNLENFRTSMLHLQALPPPCCPAQSWLKKTVQSTMSLPVTPFAPVSESRPKRQILAADQRAKWEEVVKSRNVRPDHLRYSEERLDFETPSN